MPRMKNGQRLRNNCHLQKRHCHLRITRNKFAKSASHLSVQFRHPDFAMLITDGQKAAYRRLHRRQYRIVLYEINWQEQATDRGQHKSNGKL